MIQVCHTRCILPLVCSASAQGGAWVGNMLLTIAFSRPVLYASMPALYRKLRMCLSVAVEKPADHALVLCAVLPRFMFEKIDAALGKRDRDLFHFFAKCELLRRRQKVAHNFQTPERFIGVTDFLAHKRACLCANSRRQKYG